ncbi:MAG TPA: winged helix-turn-helix domain-containing protein [Solirubrobacterales bacterium]
MAARRKAEKQQNRAAMDARYARALNHPLRAKILAVLGERAASPVDLEPVLGVPLSNISYHFRELEKFGLIEAVEQRQIRGALKTTYRASARMWLDQDAWDALGQEAKTGISIAAVTETIERARNAIERGTFDKRPDRWVMNRRMDLDEEGWAKVASLIGELNERLEAVEEEVANRKSDPAERFGATVSVLSYESP